MEFLTNYYNSNAFQRYMKTDGVREYMYFAGIKGVDAQSYTPSMSDAAMALHESIGPAKLLVHGIECKADGMVVVDGQPIGRSTLATGKHNKGITIAMWVEDYGHMGFCASQMKHELDCALWAGWWDKEVANKLNSSTYKTNVKRVQAESRQMQRPRKTRVQTWATIIKELPSTLRVKFVYLVKRAIKVTR